MFCSVTLIMFLFCNKDKNLSFLKIQRLQLENILQLMARLQSDICYVIKTRVGFEIAEITRFLNYISRYSFAL